MKSSLILKLGVGIVLIVFTLFAFVIKQECDIDKIYLYCRVHPLTILDILGLILFYGSGIFLMGFKPVMNAENSSRWNYITFAGLAAGLILVWI